MEYKLGNSKKLKEAGKTTNMICPKCNNSVEFAVFTNLDTSIIPKLPLIKLENKYLLVCPNCASMFTVDAKTAKNANQKQPLSLNPEDLKELEIY